MGSFIRGIGVRGKGLVNPQAGGYCLRRIHFLRVIAPAEVTAVRRDARAFGRSPPDLLMARHGWEFLTNTLARNPRLEPKRRATARAAKVAPEGHEP